MILTLDVGNTQIYGGVFNDQGNLIHTFRKKTAPNISSDELGLFLKSVLRENDIQPESIRKISVCSVVPEINHSIKNCGKKYFKLTPFFLEAGARTGLKIKYKNPIEVGADRIANAIAAVHTFPGKNLILIDMGTATTFCAVTAEKDYLGGIIIPGLRIAMESLARNTAKLPTVEIVPPSELMGRSTVDSIQSGLYYGNLAILKDITQRIRKEYFQNSAETMVIGTGGFSRLFEKENVFNVFSPDLVLYGLLQALKMNL